MTSVEEIPTIVQGMKIKTFQGLLDHKNPKCETCEKLCYALYRGGKKERIADFFVCKHCSIFYTLPNKKRCTLTEVDA